MSEQPVEPSKSKFDWPPLAVGGCLLIGYLAITGALITWGLPSGASPYISEMITTLRDAFMLFMMYLYGTNASSQRKTELLSKADPVKE